MVPDALAAVFLKMINLLMYYAPIGLGAYFGSLEAKAWTNF